MFNSFKSDNRGVGLIEVLVALVVVSLGLLALASFHTELMSTSGENKARSEAQNLAEDKVEELKNNILKSGFDAALVNSSETISGVNADYTRTWTVASGALSNHKLITVAIAWTGDSITIENESVWYNPTTGVLANAAEDGAGTGALAPSPNNNSSTLGGESRVSTSDGTQLGDPNDASDMLAEFWKATDSAGNVTIHFDGETDALLTCHGDTVNKFEGGIFSTNSLSALGVDISQLGICFFDSTLATTAATSYSYAPYACVSCGSCEDGGAGCAVTPNITNDIGPGGWRGKIGLRGVDDEGGGQEQVCFNEQVLDPDAGASTGREYTTHRTITATSAVTSEGINTSYECHDFLVVNRSGPDSSCATAASDLSSDTNLAPKKFTRALADSAANLHLAADTTYCTLSPTVVTLTGTITLVQTGGPSVNINKLTLATDAAGSCDTLPSNAAGTYNISCTATTVAANVTISLATTQNGATITPVTSYTVVTADNVAAFAFTVTK